MGGKTFDGITWATVARALGVLFLTIVVGGFISFIQSTSAKMTSQAVQLTAIEGDVALVRQSVGTLKDQSKESREDIKDVKKQITDLSIKVDRAIR